MSVFRALVFQVTFWLWGLFCAVAMLICQVFGFQTLVGLKRLWLRGNMVLARFIVGIRFEISGQENLPKGAAIIAMEHQSAWDALIPGLILSNPGYVLKQELLKVPLFGWLIKRWPVIALDRQASSKAMRTMLTQATQLFETRQPQLVIFPEGTRSKPGEPPVFKRGVALIYQHAQVPIVPVALNSGYYWRKGFLDFRPGTIQLSILPPIPAGLPKMEAFELLSLAITHKSKELADVSS